MTQNDLDTIYEEDQNDLESKKIESKSDRMEKDLSLLIQKLHNTDPSLKEEDLKGMDVAVLQQLVKKHKLIWDLREEGDEELLSKLMKKEFNAAISSCDRSLTKFCNSNKFTRNEQDTMWTVFLTEDVEPLMKLLQEGERKDLVLEQLKELRTQMRKRMDLAKIRLVHFPRFCAYLSEEDLKRVGKSLWDFWRPWKTLCNKKENGKIIKDAKKIEKILGTFRSLQGLKKEVVVQVFIEFFDKYADKIQELEEVFMGNKK